MAQSYQKGINTGAEANHPAQKPNVTADQGITERANERPDIASNKDTSGHTDTGGNPNVPPNPEEIKAETGDHQKQEKKDPESVDPDDEGDAPPPPPGTEYPEQKHAGKVGYGPAYAETHGVVHMSERIDGIKTEIKGKILRKPELVQQGHEKLTGEAKRKDQEKESQPIGGPKPAADPTAGDKSESKDDTDKEGKVAKGSQGDKPVAQAAQEGAEKDNKTDEPVAKEAQEKSQQGERSSGSTQRRQPEDISEKEGRTNAEKKESNQSQSRQDSSSDKQQRQQQSPNPPAPHSNQQGDEHNYSYGTQNKASSYHADENAKPNPPAPFQDQTTDQARSKSGVNTSPPKGHEGKSE